MATSCPHCHAAFEPGLQERAPCPACGRPLRFIDVPDRPCDRCRAPVPLPGPAVVNCPACGLVQPATVDRALVVRARCPRCRRVLEVAADDATGACPHCGQHFHLKPGTET